MFKVAASAVLKLDRSGNMLAHFPRGSTLLGSSLLVVLALGCASHQGGDAGSNFSSDAGFSESPRPAEVQSVTPSTPSASDLAINKRIYDMFMEDRDLAPVPSNVVTAVQDGVVTMSGSAPSKKELQKIQESLEQLPGIVRVENTATVGLWPAALAR